MKLARTLLPVLVVLPVLAPACSRSASAREPDAMFHQLSDAVQEGDVLVFLDLFPDRFLDDVDGLVHAFAGRIDREVWESGAEVVEKTGRVLGEKTRYLQKTPLVAMAAGMQPDLENELAAASAFLVALGRSDLATVEGLARMKLRATLRSILEPPLERANPALLRDQASLAMSMAGFDWLTEDFTTSTETHGPDSATVTIVKRGGGTETYEMTLVGDRWMVAQASGEWDAAMAEARARIGEFSIPPEQKEQLLEAFGTLNDVLDELLEAETQGEFDTAMNQALQVMTALGAER